MKTIDFCEIKKAAAVLGEKLAVRPTVAVVLGSGLGRFADDLRHATVVPYKEIPHMPQSTVSGHAGQFVAGQMDGVDVLCMQGRVHLYEGYSSAEVVFPIRLLAALGIKTLVLTNAAGGIHPSFRPGDLMLIRDHISLVPSPLIGENMDELGMRFPDMTHVYDPVLMEKIQKSPVGDKLKCGVYIQVSGPQYETPAEILMYQKLGADAVGMSTAIEAVAARHAGLRVIGISCITNLAAGLGQPLSHEDVKDTSYQAYAAFSKILRQVLKL